MGFDVSFQNFFLVCFKNENWILFFRNLKHFGLMRSDPFIWWKAGIGLAAATIIGFFVVRGFQKSAPTVMR